MAQQKFMSITDTKVTQQTYFYIFLTMVEDWKLKVKYAKWNILVSCLPLVGGVLYVAPITAFYVHLPESLSGLGMSCYTTMCNDGGFP